MYLFISIWIFHSPVKMSIYFSCFVCKLRMLCLTNILLRSFRIVLHHLSDFFCCMPSQVSYESQVSGFSVVINLPTEEFLSCEWTLFYIFAVKFVIFFSGTYKFMFLRAGFLFFGNKLITLWVVCPNAVISVWKLFFLHACFASVSMSTDCSPLSNKFPLPKHFQWKNSKCLSHTQHIVCKNVLEISWRFFNYRKIAKLFILHTSKINKKVIL